MLKKINEGLAKVETVFGTILVIAIFLVVIAGIVARYIFGKPLVWTEEVTNLMLIWCGYLAICYTTAQNNHVAIDLLINKLPTKLRLVWDAVLQVLIAATFLFLLEPSITSCKYQITTPALHLDLKILFTIMPITCILVPVHAVLNAIINIQELKKGEEAK